MEFLQHIIGFVVSHSITVLMTPMFWMMVLVVVFQSWQMQKQQRRMFGVTSYRIQDQLVKAIWFGVIGGFIASTLTTLFGITIDQLGFQYLWPVALVLMIANARFLCFAYAGGLVAASSILFGWPVVNVPQLLAFIAILHMTESILIYISRDYGAVPLVVRLGDGRHVGAYFIQNLWPLPLIALSGMTAPAAEIQQLLNFPSWWPILPSMIAIPDGHVLAYAALPVVAALGYSDMAIAHHPAEKRTCSAIGLALYSAALLGLAIIAHEMPSLQMIAALAAPIGHELLIQKESEQEFAGEPIFVPPANGVQLLATVADSPADQAGLKCGDIITRLNGIDIGSAMDMDEAASQGGDRKVVFRRGGHTYESQLKGENGDMYGFILVPNGNETRYAHIETEQLAVFDRLRKRRKKDDE